MRTRDLPKDHANEPKYSKNQDPAKSTYSKMASFSRSCCPCEHEQLQANRHVQADPRSHEPRVSAAQQAVEHGHGQPRQQTWRCGRFEAAMQVRRTWTMSTVTEKR